MEKILIANRGEIACRIIRSAHAMGFRTVAVYSEADVDAPHVSLADQAVCVGPAAVGESYLNIDAILEAAARTGADAIHPGYGFLSENAGFAGAVSDAGLIWIGPPASAITAMGDKASAKELMSAAGVPVAPGHSGDQSPEVLQAAADRIGYPLLIKATAGGGGRGIRIVRASEELSPALARAKSESLTAFGDDTVMLERFVEGARHVEIQVFADKHGSAVHLFERDCSLQRRRQKIIEEAPSPALSPELRQQMGEAAVAAARAVNYLGAGTVEFLLSPEGEFYFLEMNTRLQVEHPVTEMITGVDLVEWQLRVAMGEAIPLSQEALSISGHSIEARIYAEDPDSGFLPCSGPILLWDPPGLPGLRVDAGILEGGEVSSHYDPMLAKLIVHAPDRESARRILRRAVEDCNLLGLRSNLSYLSWLLAHPDFVSGDVHTGTVESLTHTPVVPSENTWLAAAVLIAGEGNGWGTRGPRSGKLTLCHEDETRDFLVRWSGKCSFKISMSDREYQVQSVPLSSSAVRLSVDGCQSTIRYACVDGKTHISQHGSAFVFSEFDPLSSQLEAELSTQLCAPMMGRVVEVHAENGDEVSPGETIIVIEAMKMEHPVRAQIAGTVTDLNAAPGLQVKSGQLLGRIQPEEKE